MNAAQRRQINDLITDSLGNTLTYTEDSNGQILTLSVNGVEVTYSYGTNNQLASVTRMAGGQSAQRLYHYEDVRNPALLTGITNELGERSDSWTYDADDRLISSERAGGADTIDIAYNGDGSTSVTNPLGKVARYSFQEIKGVRHVSAIDGEPSANCPSSNASFTYDANGLVTSKTDNKGFTTTYDYNERGLEISRTEASGTPQARTITTAWHAEFFMPMTITGPDRVIQYTYDSNGRETGRSVLQR